MVESAAEWVHFLDDGIVPHGHPIRSRLCWKFKFVLTFGRYRVQDSSTPRGVTYFWDIADEIKDNLPWGVKTNMIARRNVPDNAKYDPIFPKTGGGKDIDFCRKKWQYSLEHGGEGFRAAPEVVVAHPWWCDGKRSYRRFYMWSIGDGALVKMFPEYTYRDHTPDNAEIFLFSTFLLITGSGTWLLFQYFSITSSSSMPWNS